MNLYLLTQNKHSGYDTYDSCVVVAKSAQDARTIHPNGEINTEKETKNYYGTWAGPSLVEVTYLGKASSSQKRGVICASFNAG